ncbi:STM3941 family protein [Parabacteroides sp. PF5-9]|uniref:STM3941 family protein n=1 Tax=Parabacteroides sp. PF5-9 TaxID=1742404 RepID=UPI002473958B|nr:STM3941 family protein [Parabacteroides sp. PF5-9]MDH6356984.1 hypothetical protein [Parabacteroides sp. PF5-9]
MIPNVIRFTLIRKKVRGLFLIAILSLLCGVLEIYLSHILGFGQGKFILLLLGLVSFLVVAFCLGSLYQLRKEKFTGMYISDEGVNDISTGNNIGTVLWKDVESIKIMSDLGKPDWKYMVLIVSNPNEYIQREISRSKRRTLDLKLQYYGSPICFSNRALNCTFEQLKDAIFCKYNQYKETHSEKEQ